MTIGELIKTVRKAQRINQDILAKAVGVSQQAFSQFEKGEGGIAISKLSKIAPRLQLNDKYLRGEASNPFYSSNLIKMLLPASRSTSVTDYSLLYFLIAVNKRLRFWYLEVYMPVAGKTRLENRSKPQIYAIAVDDDDGNIFLFRRKEKKILPAEMFGFEEFEDKAKIIAKKEEKLIRFYRLSSVDLNTTDDRKNNLFKKIRDWTIERKHIEGKLSKLREVVISEESELREGSGPGLELIDYIKKLHMEPETAIELIQEWIDSHKQDKSAL